MADSTKNPSEEYFKLDELSRSLRKEPSSPFEQNPYSDLDLVSSMRRGRDASNDVVGLGREYESMWTGQPEPDMSRPDDAVGLGRYDPMHGGTVSEQHWVDQQASPENVMIPAGAEDILAPKAPIESKPYVIKKGDSLSKIAKEVYGREDMWTTIYGYNQEAIGGNPDLVAEGMVLNLPDESADLSKVDPEFHESAIKVSSHNTAIRKALEERKKQARINPDNLGMQLSLYDPNIDMTGPAPGEFTPGAIGFDQSVKKPRELVDPAMTKEEGSEIKRLFREAAEEEVKLEKLKDDLGVGMGNRNLFGVTDTSETQVLQASIEDKRQRAIQMAREIAQRPENMKREQEFHEYATDHILADWGFKSKGVPKNIDPKLEDMTKEEGSRLAAMKAKVTELKNKDLNEFQLPGVGVVVTRPKLQAQKKKEIEKAESDLNKLEKEIEARSVSKRPSLRDNIPFMARIEAEEAAAQWMSEQKQNPQSEMKMGNTEYPIWERPWVGLKRGAFQTLQMLAGAGSMTGTLTKQHGREFVTAYDYMAKNAKDGFRSLVDATPLPDYWKGNAKEYTDSAAKIIEATWEEAKEFGFAEELGSHVEARGIDTVLRINGILEEIPPSIASWRTIGFHDDEVGWLDTMANAVTFTVQEIMTQLPMYAVSFGSGGLVKIGGEVAKRELRKYLKKEVTRRALKHRINGMGAAAANRLARKEAPNAATKKLVLSVVKNGASERAVNIGVGAGTYALSSGEIYNNILEETGIPEGDISAVGGVFAAALDIIPTMKAFNRAFRKPGLASILHERFKQRAYKRYGKAVLGQSFSEFWTESGQTLIGHIARNAAIEGRDLFHFSEKDWEEAIDAGVAAMAGAAGTGAITQAMGDVTDTRELMPTAPKRPSTRFLPPAGVIKGEGYQKLRNDNIRRGLKWSFGMTEQERQKELDKSDKEFEKRKKAWESTREKNADGLWKDKEDYELDIELATDVILDPNASDVDKEAAHLRIEDAEAKIDMIPNLAERKKIELEESEAAKDVAAEELVSEMPESEREDRPTTEEPGREAGSKPVDDREKSDQESYEETVEEIGRTPEEYKARSEDETDVIPMPEEDKAAVEIKPSEIEGNGVFAKQDAKVGEPLASAFVGDNRTETGRNLNHSANPNSVVTESGAIVPIRKIESGEEITIDYGQVDDVRKARVASGKKVSDPNQGDLFGDKDGEITIDNVQIEPSTSFGDGKSHWDIKYPDGDSDTIVEPDHESFGIEPGWYLQTDLLGHKAKPPSTPLGKTKEEAAQTLIDRKNQTEPKKEATPQKKKSTEKKKKPAKKKAKPKEKKTLTEKQKTKLKQMADTAKEAIAKARKLFRKLRNPQDWEYPENQQYKSKLTSINARLLPAGITAAIKLGVWAKGMVNLDIGGGRYNNTTEAINSEGATNYTYDPWNRTVEENLSAAEAAEAGVDTVTIHNTLNVIKEAEVIDRILRQAHAALKAGGKVFITVYVGDGTGIGKETFGGESWQRNEKLNAKSEYLKTTRRYFKDAKIVNGMIVATKGVSTKQETVTEGELKKFKLKRGGKGYKVGKVIGSNIYVHKDYEVQFPKAELEAAKKVYKEENGDKPYQVVKYNSKTGAFSFIFSSDFDSNSEPSINGGITIKPDGTSKKFGDAGWIYHHKWMFVGDDYKGFDTEAEKQRSIEWASLEDVDKARIGQRKFWDENVAPRLKKAETIQTAKKAPKKKKKEAPSGTRPGFTKFSKSIDKMVAEKTLTPDDAVLIKEIFKDTSDDFLLSINVESNPYLKKTTGRAYEEGRRATVKKGLANLLSPTSSADINSLVVFLHEYGHLAEMFLLTSAAEKATIKEVFNELKREGRLAHFQTGLSDKLDGTQKGGWYFTKNPEEFLVQAFAEYLITNKVPDGKLLPLMKKMAKKLMDGIRRLVDRKEHDAIKKLEPLFEKMLSGEGNYAMNSQPVSFREDLKALLGVDEAPDKKAEKKKAPPPPTEPPVSETPQPVTPPEKEIVGSAKNELSDQIREARGFNAIESDVEQTNEETMAEAKLLIREDREKHGDPHPGRLSGLADMIIENLRQGAGIDVINEAILVMEHIRIQVNMESNVVMVNDTKVSETDRLKARRNWDASAKELDRIEYAQKLLGTRVARVLQFRTRVVTSKYTLTAMERADQMENQREKPISQEIMDLGKKSKDNAAAIKAAEEAKATAKEIKDLKKANKKILKELEKLTDEYAEITKNAKKHAQAVIDRDNVTSAVINKEATADAEKLIEEYKKEIIGDISPSVIKWARKRVDQLKKNAERKKKRRSEINAKYDKGSIFSGKKIESEKDSEPEAEETQESIRLKERVELISILIQEWAAYLADGAMTAVEYESALLKEYGNDIKSFIPDIIEKGYMYAAGDFKPKREKKTKEEKAFAAVAKSKKTKTISIDDVVADIKKKINDYEPTTEQPEADITGLVEKMVKQYIREGITDVNDLAWKVHEALVDSVDGLSIDPKTKRPVEAMQLIGKYGKRKKPSSVQAHKDYRNARAEALLLAKIHRAANQLSVARTGLQRDKKTDELRRLERKFNRYMREAAEKGINLKVGTKEDHIASTLDALKTRAENQLVDIQYEIDKLNQAIEKNEQRKPPKGPEKVEDPDLTELKERVKKKKAELAEVQKAHDQTFKVENIDDGTQLKRAIKLKELQIKIHAQMLADRKHRRERKTKDPLPPSDILDERKKTDQWLKEELQILRDLDVEYRQERDAVAVEKSTANYLKKIKNNEYVPITKKMVEDNPNLADLRKKQQEVIKIFKENQAKDPRFIAANQKKIDDALFEVIMEMFERIQSGDVGARKKPLRIKSDAERMRDLLATQIRKMQAEQKRKTPEQKEKARLASLTKQYEKLKKDIRDEKWDAEKREEKEYSPQEQLMRDQIAALHTIKRQKRNAALPKKTRQDIQLQAYKTRAENKLAALHLQLRTEDFETKPRRKGPDLDAEALELEKKILIIEQEIENAKFLKALNNRSLWEKHVWANNSMWKYTSWMEGFNFFRGLMTGGEMSAFLRQGGFLFLSKPMVTAKGAVPTAFKVLFSKDGFKETQKEIESRDSYKNMVRDGLFLADAGATLTNLEEEFQGRLIKKLPLGFGKMMVKFQDSYTAFLNRQRADAYDAMVYAYSKPEAAVPMSADGGAVIASFVNIATGRGDLGKANNISEGLALAFFSPRYVTSRFQLLGGLVYHPTRGIVSAVGAKMGSKVSENKEMAKIRGQISGEYARAMLGGYAVLKIASMMLDMGEEEEDEGLEGWDKLMYWMSISKKIETDPTSSQFLKLNFGNTHIDPFFGLLQTTVLLSRLRYSQIKSSSGEIKDLSGEDKAYGMGVGDVLHRFYRSKLSPLGSTVSNFLIYREDFMGDPVNLRHEVEGYGKFFSESLAGVKSVGSGDLDQAKKDLENAWAAHQSTQMGQLTFPITWGDIGDNYQEHNIPKATALSMVAFFGAGVNVYDPEARKKKNKGRTALKAAGALKALE